MNKGEWLASRGQPLSIPQELGATDAAQTAWASFGQWVEIVTYQAGGDTSGVDLTLWAKWFGEGMDPADAVIRYRCETDGHEFAYDADEDPDDGPMHCMHCGDEDPAWTAT